MKRKLSKVMATAAIDYMLHEVASLLCYARFPYLNVRTNVPGNHHKAKKAENQGLIIEASSDGQAGTWI